MMQEIKFSSPSVDAEFVLYQIFDAVQGTIIKRPSQHCKTPYMADAIIHSSAKEILAHTPSLGCCRFSRKRQPCHPLKNRVQDREKQPPCRLSIHKKETTQKSWASTPNYRNHCRALFARKLHSGSLQRP